MTLVDREACSERPKRFQSCAVSARPSSSPAVLLYKSANPYLLCICNVILVEGNLILITNTHF